MSHGPESAFTKWLNKYKYINIALIYLGTALVIIHFAEAVVHGLHMPDITFSLIVILALAGLPIVLLIAWAMGHKKADTIDEAVIAKPIKRNWSKIITASVLIIVLFTAAIFIYNKFFYHSKFTGKEKSIAVLPFKNMSSDKENEYFSDGMTEEITTQLSKIGELKVIARTSSMLYKDSKKSIKEIAEELGVSAILEGSVQKSGDAIRITAQLIDANSQEHIWAEKYDRDFKDVFAVQSDVAQAIAAQLNAKLTNEEKKKIEKAATTNSEAYKYYLQAYQLHQNYWETRKPEQYEKSRALFEKALELDSNYVLAHAGLADLYNTYSQSDPEIISLQLKEINKAWLIDSLNDYVNYVKGSIEQKPLNNRDNAFKYYKKAIELNPNNTDNLWGMALLIGPDFGLVDEGYLLFDRIIKLDPLAANNFFFRGLMSFQLNDLKNAEKDLTTAVRLNPEFVLALDLLARLYAVTGRLDEANKWLAKSFQIKPSVADHRPGVIANVYAKLGDKKKALALARPSSRDVFLEFGMKEEALKGMPFYDEKDSTTVSIYLNLKANLNTKEFQLIKNDPVFLEILERNKQKYEENKRKYSVMDIIRSFPSSTH